MNKKKEERKEERWRHNTGKFYQSFVSGAESALVHVSELARLCPRH